ncbi:hypothetical protein HF521_011088 [Silurus meridionalis]|uniref:CHK kinase-like domain-containing protein n=1 Tax=Silurus meridionalis TaxID=175797 RepID=A0A8T0AKH2_SILME|nr:hypothetical protein HF521_011088 [Silurus meridionalis]
MKQEHQDLILQATCAERLRMGCKIQTLWSGYGQIVRVHLHGCERSSVVVKHVMFPKACRDTDVSHRRKVRSYQVETHWYKNYLTNERCRIPECLAAQSFGEEQLMVLEDLDVAGFPDRRTSVRDGEIKACLRWLANFHGLFLGVPARGLWPVGTYWHLETRPDELEALTDLKLKAAAPKIDAVLNSCRFKTILHGDAKLANFCFSKDGSRGCCGLPVRRRGAVPEKEKENFSELEDEWRLMFAFAWTDFHRFLLGWMPGHHKINRYSRRLTQEVLKKLAENSNGAKQ